MIGPPKVPPNSFCEYPRGDAGVPERMADAPAAVCLPAATSPANWLARDGQLAGEQNPLNGLRASKISLRANSQADPWKWLPPDLVTMFTTPPSTFPYCASLLCDCTLNSCTVSAMGGMAHAPPRSSVLMMPSMYQAFERFPAPLTEGL